MKRLKFKKPFNGMDNAKKLIPESYKVDGNEFEITDGIETYRVKWSTSLNEATILMSSNKNLINEDVQKMKHLMGFKSEETLGIVKGAARLDENKKFGDVLNKTKKLINESEEPIDYTMGKKDDPNQLPNPPKQINLDIEEAEGPKHLKSGMGGSNKGKSRTDKTETLKKASKKQRRQADKAASKELNEFENPDVENLANIMSNNSKIQTAASKINTREEKIEAATEYVKMVVGDDKALQEKIARELLGNEDEQQVDTSATNEALNEMEVADDYSERESMAGAYQENPEGYIKQINSLLNRQVRRKGIPGDLGFTPNNPLEGDIALFSSPELLIDVAINDSFGFDVYYSQHVDGEDFDTIYGDSDEYSGGQPMRYTQDRMEMDTVADNVSFDQALIKVGELLGNNVSEDSEMDRFDEVFEGMYEEESHEGFQVKDICNFEVNYTNVKDGDYHEDYLGTKGGDEIYELTLRLVDDNACLILIDDKQIFLNGEITCAYSQSWEYEDNSFDHEFGTHDPGSGYVINEMGYFSIRNLDIRVIGEEDAEGNEPLLKTIKTGEISKEEFNNIFSGFNLYDTLRVTVNDIIHEAANDGDILPPDNY